MKTNRNVKIPGAVRKQLQPLIDDGYRVTNVYTYRDSHGKPAFRKIRLEHATEPKEIRPVHLNGDRQYVLKMPARPKSGFQPYNASRIRKKAKAKVWFVEGEKCADALTQTGLVSTTTGGTSTIESFDLRVLKDRNIIVWPDQDAAGRRYASAIIERLMRLSTQVRVIDIDALELASGDDCVEWLDKNKGASTEDLRGLPTVPGWLWLEHESNISRIASNRHSLQERWPITTPWPAKVEARQLVNRIFKVIRRHVVASKETQLAATLWIVYTWLFDCFDVSPLANVSSAEKQCGKSVLLTVLRLLTQKPLQTSNVTPAALFRLVDECQPTLLIDEFDSFGKLDEAMRGILNSGHTRYGAVVYRCEGDDHKPRGFSTWAPKAVCGIGEIQETLADRSIPLRLHRKKPDESVSRLNESSIEWSELRSKISRFANDCRARIRDSSVTRIKGLNDRENDSWRPLLAVASVISRKGVKATKRAAQILHRNRYETESVGFRLLSAIKKIFDESGKSRLHTKEILQALIQEAEGPWAKWSFSQPINENQMADILRKYEIRSKQFRSDGKNCKGYILDSFRDAFARYVRKPAEHTLDKAKHRNISQVKF